MCNCCANAPTQGLYKSHSKDLSVVLSEVVKKFLSRYLQCNYSDSEYHYNYDSSKLMRRYVHFAVLATSESCAARLLFSFLRLEKKETNPNTKKKKAV